MTQPIVYIDRSRIRPGRLADVEQAVAELVAFIEEREPQLIHYGFYVDRDAGRMTVIAVHPDPASVELHMAVGADAFRRFANMIELEGIEVYGPTSPKMLEQLDAKAAALGEHGTVTVAALAEGFHRLPR